MGLAAAQYVYKETGGRGRGGNTEGKEGGSVGIEMENVRRCGDGVGHSGVLPGVACTILQTPGGHRTWVWRW